MRLLTLILVAASVSSAADIAIVEEIIAKVNGDIITRGDISRYRAEAEASFRQQGLKGAQLDEAVVEQEKNALRERIDQLLLIQKGKDLNIKVDSEVSKNLAEMQKRSKQPDPDKFQQFIREQMGMSYEDFRAEMINNLLTQRVIRQEVGGKMNLKHEELEKYYNEHKAEFVREERIFLRELLISTAGKDAAGIAASEKKAKDLVERGRKGERFPELARDNSDAVTAQNFGDLGGFKKGELDPKIEAALWSQPKGYVSDPIKVENGILILKVDDHQKAGQAELAEVEGEIQEKLYMPRMQPAIRTYLTELRKSAFLEIKPGWVDSGAAPNMDTSWKDPAQLKPETVTKAEVSNKPKHKKLLWAVPIPGTKQKDTSTSK